MKRLFALLLLVVAPAFAQEYTPGPYLQPPPPPAETENLIYTTLNPPPNGAQHTWTGFINTGSQGGGLSGGNVPGYNPVTGTFLFGYFQGTVTYNLYNSPEFPGAGASIDSFNYSWEYFNQDYSRGSLSANISFFAPNNSLLESFNFLLPQTTLGWTLFDGVISFADAYNQSEIGRLQVSFTGKDDRFWAGYYGPQVRDLDLSLNYTTPPPPPPSFLYWEHLAGENGFFTLTEPGVVRYGANGVYIYAEFQPGTYACTNGDWGNDPIGGVVKSCEFGSNMAPPVASVDCDVTPNDPTCIIDSLTDPDNIIDSITAVADTSGSNGSDDGSDDGTTDTTTTTTTNDTTPVQETVVAVVEEPKVEQTATQETALEKLLVDEEKTTAEKAAPTEEKAAISRELADDGKAAVLADSISKNTLEAALSVAVNAELASTTQATASVETATTSSDTTTKTTSVVAVTEAVAEATSSSVSATTDMVADNAKEETSTNDNNAGVDVLETGRQLGQSALAVTLNATAESAADSTKQAENIASTSSAESQTVVASNVETVTAVVESAAQSNTESDSTQTQVADASNNQQEQTSASVADVSNENNATIEIQTAEEVSAEPEVVVAETKSVEQSSAVEFTSVEVAMEMFAAKLSGQTEITDQQELENNIVQQSLASTQQQEDAKDSSSEAEAITIANDPALANAFNVAPNMTNLELTGALSQKQEEKSDAEKMADKVVAANKEEQEKINSNYMDADQSGIVAAIGADTDVTSYRTAMLRDNNNWYKPEDIYKNMVYKDNVRGAYFLEKGNTDTYKKMVEEQYK